MEFNNAEAKEIQATVCDATHEQVQQLDELQLSYVGGGNVIIIIG